MGRRSAALLLVLVTAACRHAAPPAAPLPAGWRALTEAARPFAALYRLTCCGHRGLVLTVRGDGERLALAVAVPPGGTALSAWIGPDGGFLRREQAGCREALAPGELPLGNGASLPLDPALAALLLSGRLPAGAREDPMAAGWVEATAGGYAWRAQVAGPAPHWTRVVVARADGGAPLTVVRRDEVGAVPHLIDLAVGPTAAELDLQAWRPSAPPLAPAWLAAPLCGARP